MVFCPYISPNLSPTQLLLLSAYIKVQGGKAIHFPEDTLGIRSGRVVGFYGAALYPYDLQDYVYHSKVTPGRMLGFPGSLTLLILTVKYPQGQDPGEICILTKLFL